MRANRKGSRKHKIRVRKKWDKKHIKRNPTQFINFPQ